MATIQQNFSEQTLNLITSGPGEQNEFDPIQGHYLRMSVSNDGGGFFGLFYSNRDAVGDPVTYSIPSPYYACSGVSFITEGEVVDIPGDHGPPPPPPVNACSDITFPSILPPEYISLLPAFVYCNDIENPSIQESIQISEGDTTQVLPNYIGLTGNQICNDLNPIVKKEWIPSTTPQLKLYTDENNNFYAKPNDTFAEAALGTGNYNLQFDFLDNPFIDFQFFINEISPSRKEVRLGVRNLWDENADARDIEFSSVLETGGVYQFDHVLGLPLGENVPIVNYTIDDASDSDFATIILKLNNPLSANVSTVNLVTVEREIFVTQIERVWFQTDVEEETFLGAGLERSGFIEAKVYSQDQDTFQTKQDLTSSLLDSTVEQFLFSGSKDINLNIDFNNFSNHVFFGSAASKLEKFKSKVENIQGYLSDVSASLSGSGVSLSGDSSGKINRRKQLFGKVQDEINLFTPYERFLYYDNQSETTASAPGLGINLAQTIPVATRHLSASGYADGFNMVYKHSDDIPTGRWLDIFTNKYRAEERPFFNHSGSFYLSFLLKGHHSIPQLQWYNRNVQYANHSGKQTLPYDAFHKTRLLNPTITGSEWGRHVYVASQSYWRPNISGWGQVPVRGWTSYLIESDFTAGSTQIEILSSSEQIQLASNVPTGSSYPVRLSGDFYPSLGTVITGSGIPFTGSLMPAGELFRIYYYTGSSAEVTSSFITDVKVTTKDPTNALPFTSLYTTGSTEWTSWYGGLYASASQYDKNNIHSLVNNIPSLISEDPDSGDLKTFINLLGDQYDLIRNYIDNYLTFYKRRYKKLESVPTNLLPILAKNFGWDVIQPFTGSISQYFGTSEQDTVNDSRTIEQITHNTWRKVLNNLIYIYKTKGTHNAVKALLNVYGYPPDVLSIQEFGGSSQEHNPTIISNEIKKLLTGVSGQTDNVSFNTRTGELYSWIFNNDSSRILNFDWWTNNAINLNTIEFILKPLNTFNDQILLESSGSTSEKLWDVRLVATGSDSTLGKFQFRLNNTHTGSSAIGSNAVSMSTSYLSLKEPGKLWHVMLQRMTSSISGSGIQEYRLYTGLQKKDKITEFSAVSMSVSGGATADANHYANQNWLSTGSLSTAASGNLYVGRTYTGSLAELRMWSTALSASKFKQHILNKKSIVGNNIEASRNEIAYHYALNENWKSGSLSPKIKDSNSSNVKDFSLNISSDLLTGSVLYDRDEIDIVTFSIRIGGSDQPNTNKILIDPDASSPIISNLNPDSLSIRTIYSDIVEKKRYHTSKIEITRSPQTVLNDFIVDALADMDLSTKFADPSDLYETFYGDLDRFREQLFRHYNVQVNINTWIRAQRNVFNNSLLNDLNKMLPVRISMGSNENLVGVIIQPTLLERSKIKNPEASLAIGSEIGYISVEHDIVPYINLSNTSVFDPITSLNPIEITSDISLANSIFNDTKNATYDINQSIIKLATYESTKNATYDINEAISKTMTHTTTKDGTYDMIGNITKIFSVVLVPEGEDLSSRDLGYASFINLSNNWGTSSDDTHFVNMEWSASSRRNNMTSDEARWQNVNYYEPNYVYQMVGDVEVISSSRPPGVGEAHTDYSDSKFFLNRQIRNKGRGFIYKSYINVGGNSEGPQDGRPVGKTAYFATRSDGEILYPPNHYIKFSEDSMRDNFIGGYQNMGGSFLPIVEQEDLSTSSFYSVTVTGEDKLIVRRGKADIGSGGIINRK